MEGMKYVVYSDDTFSIFPPTLNHSDMRVMGKTPVSAGFVRIDKVSDESDAIKVACYGDSVSLGLKSRHHEDEEVIESGYRICFI